MLKQEVEVKISESVFKNTIIHSSFGFAILGNSGIIRMANNSLKKMFNYGLDELEGKFLKDFFHSDDQKKFIEELNAIRIGSRDSSTIELGYSVQNGENRWCRCKLNLVPHPEKDSWILTACLEDITEYLKLIETLKKSSQQAERARYEAELATKTKSEFLANTSHEIRTPIHTIIGMTELMLDTALDPEQQEYAEQVQFSADVLLSLINDILDFEKIEAGKLKLESIEMSLFEILENAMDLVVLEGHRKGLEMILDVGPDVPNRIVGDPVRLRQILVNLVNNAIKFTASGEIHLSVRPEEVYDGISVVRFSVRDTGIGISDEKKNKLFKEFSQVDSSTTRKYGGTGLGLSISKKLSEMMNGRIGVESNEGEGSTFWFTAEFKVLPDDDRFFSRDRFGNHSVLIADDNENSLIVLKRYIEEWGCKVDTVSSGQDGLDMLKDAWEKGTPYNSCYVNLKMPRMDGWHFASEVKTSDELKDTALFLLSPAGQGTIEPKMKLLNWFAGYLDKPVKKSRLFLSYCRQWEEGVIPEELEKGKAAAGEEEMELGCGNILVAEDHEVNQQLFKTILENQGQNVTIANNGLEAVEAVEKKSFDIIFMDVQMPEMNGYEATMKIRDIDIDIPIIAVTASAIKGERDKCISVGMTDFLTKPFKKKDIIPFLYKYLGEAIGCLEELEDAEELESQNESGFVPEQLNLSRSAVIDDAYDVELLDDLEEVDELESPNEPEFVTELEPLSEIEEAEDEEEVNPLEVFDLDEALDTFMGNRDLVLRLLRTQVEKVRDQIPVMNEALAAAEWDTLRESAHSIKGGSWNLQAKEMGDCAFEAETSAKEEDYSASEKALVRISEAYIRLKTRAEMILGEDV